MTAAVDRGDLDEAARQGALAGPAVVERALASKVRSTVLAGIVAAPAVEDRAELLPALARLAAGHDRRTAIPAARAARTIASALSKKDLPDDLAPDDLQGWRSSFEQLAFAGTGLIEARVAALETAAALEHAIDPRELGFDLARALGDTDPALRIAALTLVPRPSAVALRAALVTAIEDRDADVALTAAQTLCTDIADDPAGVKAALGGARAQLEALVKTHPNAAESRDAARCLK